VSLDEGRARCGEERELGGVMAQYMLLVYEEEVDPAVHD
jgi:hypothetical protein